MTTPTEDARAAIQRRIDNALDAMPPKAREKTAIDVTVPLWALRALIEPPCEHDWQNRVSGGSLCSKCNVWQDKRVEPPTDDEREALEAAIGYAPVPLSIRDHPEIRFEYRTIEDRDGLVECILAAGFSRRQVSHPEPEQWEYGCRQEDGYVASVGAAWMNLEYAQKVSANDSAVMGVRRRKAGPWLPVPEEEK